MNFADRLIDLSREKNSVLVVGLDTDLKYFPDFLTRNIRNDSYQEIGKSLFYFNKIVIDSVSDIVLAVKPQSAFYEIYGSYGIRALEETVQYAKSKGLIVIIDVKRGDIDSTSLAYAKAYLGNNPFSGDMVTVNPFLGSDGYNPFIETAKQNDKGIFLLLKTSNPSSAELQDLVLQNGKKVYQKMAETFFELSKNTVGKQNYSFIGVVVGATYPSIAKEIRELLPYSLFLVPGFGFQGGKPEDLKAYFDKNGNGAVISSSRGIIYAYTKEKEDWKNISEEEMTKIIRNKAISDNNAINKIRAAHH